MTEYCIRQAGDKQRMPQQVISITFTTQESACLHEAAENAGLLPEEWLKRAMTRQAIIEKDPDLARNIIAGLDDVEAGRVISHAHLKERMGTRFGPRFSD